MYNTFRHFRRFYPLALCSVPVVGIVKAKTDINEVLLNNDYRSLKYMLESNDQSTFQYNQAGMTPLILAVIHNRTMLVKLLLENGADPDSQDKYQKPRPRLLGGSEFIYDPDDVVKMDTRKKYFPAHFNINNNYYGATALFYAVLNNNPKMVELLIENGADPLIRMKAGYNAFDVVNRDSPEGDKIKELLMKGVKQRDQIILEKRKKYPLEARLSESVIGQKGAIDQISGAIRRKENGWVDSDHPIVMLFLGSSGIGKTELAKQVAKYIHQNDKDGFVRLDMSEYASQHEVARLVGAPPGYVGHETGGQLTEALTKCPNAVVLFDEIEKAHPDALPILLGLFDEGRLTDGKGKTIECKDAIFIMTSNLAQDEIARYGLSLRSKGDQKEQVDKDFKQNVVKPILKFHFKRDEFLGRINEFVYFLPFSDAELRQLVEMQLTMWKKIASEKHNIQLSWTEDVVTVLTDGYDVSYGARSVKHETERKIVSRLAKAFEDGKLRGDDQITLCCELPNDIQDYQNVKIQLKNDKTSKYV